LRKLLAEVVGFPEHLIGDLSHLPFPVFCNNKDLTHYMLTPFSLRILRISSAMLAGSPSMNWAPSVPAVGRSLPPWSWAEGRPPQTECIYTGYVQLFLGRFSYAHNGNIAGLVDSGLDAQQGRHMDLRDFVRAPSSSTRTVASLPASSPSSPTSA